MFAHNRPGGAKKRRLLMQTSRFNVLVNKKPAAVDGLAMERL